MIKLRALWLVTLMLALSGCGGGGGATGGPAAVTAGDAKAALLEGGTPLAVRLTSPVTLTIER